MANKTKNKKMSKGYSITASLLIWAIYISLPVFLLPKSTQFLQENELSRMMYIVISVISICLFYFNYLFAIPKLAIKDKLLTYIVTILAFGFLMYLSIIVSRSILSSYFQNSTDISASFIVVSHIFRNILMLIASFALFYFKRYKEIENEKIKAELKALKAQINPHFFFNTLNIIYGQAITKSDKTTDSISKLSSMMRYVLSDAHQDSVKLSEEIQYIESYIDLQKMRLTNKTTVNFQVEGNPVGFTIPSLIFITIIENAFKYGVSTEIETTIDIKIELKNNVISLMVKNDIPRAKDNKLSSTNIGLKNTKKRLELLFDENYSLDIKDDNSIHKVTLKILQ